MDSTSKRPWYRLHWLTWVVMGVIICGLAISQYSRETPSATGSTADYDERYTYGWPVSVRTIEIYELGNTRAEAEGIGDGRDIFVNIVFCTLLVFATVFVCERWHRGARHQQFTLRQLLIVTAVVGVLLMGCMNGFVFNTDEPSVIWYYMRLPSRWPVLFAYACTIYFLGWLPCAGALRLWSFLRGARS